LAGDYVLTPNSKMKKPSAELLTDLSRSDSRGFEDLNNAAYLMK
jgi:hypothetical protein